MNNKRNLIRIWLLTAALLQAAISGAQPVTKVAAGGNYSMFLKSGGSLWVMGENQNGQLGDGTINPTNRPEKIVVTNVTAIAAGDTHSLFLKSDNSLWTMGYNNSGQLGDGTTDESHVPKRIVITNVTAIAAGGMHSLFLKSDGSLWGMGNNYEGELGDGTSSDSYAPKQIVASGVTTIAAGYYHSLFSQERRQPVGHGLRRIWPTGRRNFRRDQPTREDCGQRRHSDCRRMVP